MRPDPTLETPRSDQTPLTKASTEPPRVEEASRDRDAIQSPRPFRPEEWGFNLAWLI